MEITQALRRNAATRANDVALIFEDTVLTWQRLEERVAKFASALAGIGVRDGDRVAILADNSHRYIEFFFATAWAGGVFVPLNHRLAPAELAAIMADAGATILLVDAIHLGLGKQLLELTGPDTTVIFADDGTAPEGWLSYEDMIAESSEMPDQRRSGDDLAGIFYTGGTTGLPKGVMHSHDNIWLSAITFACQVGVAESTRSLVSAPLFHVGALAITTPSLIAGGTLVVLRRFEAGAFLRAIEEYRIEVFNTVPTMLRMLVDHPDVGTIDWSSVKTLIFGASPMDPSLFAEAQAIAPDVDFRQAYGMTEVTGCLTMTPQGYLANPNAIRDGHISVGTPVLGAEVMVTDEEGQPCASGVIGEVRGRGAIVSQGYWMNEEGTRAAFEDGWYRTGDAGYLTDDNHLYIVDRLKDMIKTGGENVYSTEVEAAIYSYGGISQCAVVGLPDPKWGEIIHAFVVPAEGVEVSVDELLAHCRSRIAGFKCPRSMDIRSEPLPLSGASKFQKNELRKLAGV